MANALTVVGGVGFVVAFWLLAMGAIYNRRSPREIAQDEARWWVGLIGVLKWPALAVFTACAAALLAGDERVVLARPAQFLLDSAHAVAARVDVRILWIPSLLLSLLGAIYSRRGSAFRWVAGLLLLAPIAYDVWLNGLNSLLD